MYLLTAPGPPGWGLGGGLITRSQKMLFITETEARTTTAPYREAGVKDVNTPYNVDRLTTSCFYLTNTQLTKPARVNGPFVIVMERRPAALPNMSGTKSILTTHHLNASREAAANWKRNEKHMDDYVRFSPKSQSVSKVVIIIKSGLRS